MKKFRDEDVRRECEQFVDYIDIFVSHCETARNHRDEKYAFYAKKKSKQFPLTEMNFPFTGNRKLFLSQPFELSSPNYNNFWKM